jgi:hypothetical protein
MSMDVLSNPSLLNFILKYSWYRATEQFGCIKYALFGPNDIENNFRLRGYTEITEALG